MEDLENAVRQLEERMDDVVHKARNEGLTISSEVEEWLGSAQRVAVEARELLIGGESAKNARLLGWIPNPMVPLPSAKKLKEMTQDIQGLNDRSTKGIVPATTSFAISVDRKEDVLESRASITKEVMKAITDDKNCVVGVYGPGGVGKSKLLDDIVRRVMIEKRFDVVIKANVSRNPDLKTIQGEIVDALGLELMNVETVRGRANRLCERLECDRFEKVLIILDDLWKKLELKDVGIPCDNYNKVRGCKLLLSSRNREVLRIGMGADQEFRLNELEDAEARRLLERTIEDKVNDPEFKWLVDRVVKNCGGLPRLILWVAKRLKHGDLVEQRNALTNINWPDAKSLVEPNYNDLKDERIKSLFLVCALHNGRRSLRDTLVYCMGLGLFKKFNNTIEEARGRLIMDLCSLQDSSLLLDSDVTEEVRMHGIFVDVAISMHDKFIDMEWNALVGMKDRGFKEWPEDELRKCTAIAFHFVGIADLLEKLDCPNLRMLLLSESNPSLKIPELFFESMKKLQVLDLTHLSFISLPSSIEFLENLKSLCLDFCHLEDVAILGKLKGLQFLSFLGSTITRLPKEIGRLKNLRFLDLTGCMGLKVIEPSVLGSLVNLEELYMEDSFDQWEAKDEAPRSNASLAELKNMKKLTTLCIAILHSAILSRDLPFGKLNKHKIQIGDVWDWSSEYKECRTLKLKLDSSNLLLEEWVQKCLQRTQDLHLDGLQDYECFHDLCVKGFQELKYLHLQNSPSLRYIVHSPENYQCWALMKLESIFLENLNNLEEICHDCPTIQSFNKLKIVKMDNCGEIKHLFSFSMMRIFLQLEEIEITRCHLMQHIVADAETDEEGDEIGNDLEVKSGNLRRLTLRNLPKMTSFCTTVDNSISFFNRLQVSLPWLECLTLSKLPKLKEIWNSQFPSNMSYLKFLKVEDCSFVSSVIPSNLLIKLQNLEAITVERCQLVEELFHLEGLIASGVIENLSGLRELTLSDLPSLRRIWNKNPRRMLCFQNLRLLKVQNCENLRFRFSYSMAKSLWQIKEIKIVSCKLMEEIIDVQEEELEEAASSDTLVFPMLTSLSLKELPNLRTFSCGKYIHCPSLTRLKISRCPKMMTFSSYEGRQHSVTTDVSLQQAFGPFDSGLSLPGFFNETVLFPSLEELKLSSMCQLKRIWHNQLPGQSFCKLASLTVELCENLSHVFQSNSMDRLQSLNKIEVVGCPSLEALFEPISLSSEKRQKPLVLSALKKMELLNLPKLRDILKSECKVTLVFPSLMEMNVRSCHSLPYLFSSATAKYLDKLVKLDVTCCHSLCGIIAMEEGKGKTVDTFKFRNLSTLKLRDLESLICFNLESCAGDGLYPLFDEKIAFPKLEELNIEGVQQKNLWSDKILPESFCRLKVLKVKRCHNLLNMFPSFMWKCLLHCMESLTVDKCPCLRNLFTLSMAKSLGQLQYLGLGGCEEMEYIVAREEEKPEETTDKIIIPQLVTLYLHNMPKLRSFCQGKHISEWPSLKEFTVEDCKAVELILGDTSCRKLEDKVPTHQPLLLVEKVEFSNMELMKISHTGKMEKIWLDKLASNAFSKLKTLIVEHCEKLSSIFSSGTILTRFQNLDKLIVTNCDSLEVIFHVQDFNSIENNSTSIFQLRELVLTWLPKLKHVWSGLPQGALNFGHLRCLKAVKCQSLKSLFPISVAKSMTQLEELGVWCCGVEKIIVEEDGGAGTSAHDFFAQLIALTLVDLPKLKSIYRNSHTSTWPLLKELRVRHCGKTRSFSFAGEIQSSQGTIDSDNQPALFSLEKVIPHLEQLTFAREDVVMMQHDIFGNLRELVVDSSSFEEIFQKDAYGFGRATPCGGLIDMQKPPNALGNLKRLRLINPFNLRQVWKDGSIMAEIIKQIESLFISWCPSLSIIFQSPTSFQRLIELEVVDCASLVHIGTCSALTNMAHLTRLTLRDCVAIEDVVTDDENGAEKISFPKLEELILDGLPSLESFSPMDCTFMFPSLVRVIVMQCPKMKIFCNDALRTPKLDKLLLSYWDDEGCWESDLNTTVQTLSA